MSLLRIPAVIIAVLALVASLLPVGVAPSQVARASKCAATSSAKCRHRPGSLYSVKRH